MSTIADFYAHRDVLVTGATGFLGKVLVEKLLRACPLIGRIYVLIRSKNGQDGKERFLQLQNSMVFLKFSRTSY